VGDPEAMNFTVWQDQEVIAGMSYYLQFAPFQENNAPLPVDVFAPQLFRNVYFDYSNDVVVQGINMRRYYIRESE